VAAGFVDDSEGSDPQPASRAMPRESRQARSAVRLGMVGKWLFKTVRKGSELSQLRPQML
jgi:hypothetical protein